jgi:alkylation response protein AidB-like acyl-CoA dehydrogenase
MVLSKMCQPIGNGVEERFQRLGAVGQGWDVPVTTLMNERMSIDRVLATADGLAIADRAVRAHRGLGGQG